MAMAACQFSSLWYFADGPRAAYLGVDSSQNSDPLEIARDLGRLVGSQEWEKKCEARPLDRLNEMLRRHRAAARAVPMLKVRLSARGVAAEVYPATAQADRKRSPAG